MASHAFCAFVEPLARERHPLQASARSVGSAGLLPTREPLHDRSHADRVGVTQQPPTEGRESGAEDHREIDVARVLDYPIVQRERRLVHHGVDQAIGDLGRGHRLARRRE